MHRVFKRSWKIQDSGLMNALSHRLHWAEGQSEQPPERDKTPDISSDFARCRYYYRLAAHGSWGVRYYNIELLIYPFTTHTVVFNFKLAENPQLIKWVRLLLWMLYEELFNPFHTQITNYYFKQLLKDFVSHQSFCLRKSASWVFFLDAVVFIGFPPLSVVQRKKCSMTQCTQYTSNHCNC